MADPVNTFIGTHLFLLSTFDTGSGAYSVEPSSVAGVPWALGDDVSDNILADGSLGDGTESTNEYAALQPENDTGNIGVQYLGYTINGAPVFTDGASFYYVLTDENIAGTSGTATVTPTFDYAAFCFLPGTRLATPAGERAIETLAIGDLVTTASGAHKAVKWIGRMTLPLNRFTRATAVPVCVKAGALGNGLPQRDLYVSNDHALLIDGLLVQAGALVDGVNFVRCLDHAGDSIEYFHVELEDHEVILAEGAATESLWANDEIRAKFDNAAEFAALYPQHVTTAALEMARVKFARQVPRVLLRRLGVVAA